MSSSPSVLVQNARTPIKIPQGACSATRAPMAPKSKKPIEREGILALKTPRRRVKRLAGFARPELLQQQQLQEQAAPAVSTKPRPTKRARDDETHDSKARVLFPDEPPAKRRATTDAPKVKKWKIPKKKQAAAPTEDGTAPLAEPLAAAPASVSDAFMMDAEDIATLNAGAPGGVDAFGSQSCGYALNGS